MRNFSIKVFLIFGVFFLGGCQTTNNPMSGLLEKFSYNKENPSENKNKEPISSFFDDFIEQFSKNSPTKKNRSTVLIDTKAPEFKPFTKSNARYNVLLAVNNHPSVKTSIANAKAAKETINTVLSAKESQISFQALGGVSRENASNALGAAGTISISKLLFDAGAIDSATLSQRERYELAKVQAEISAETAAIRAFEAWIDLDRQRKILAVYQDGLVMAEPILGQIKNISMSGLSDKAMILKAQQDYAKLEVANATAKGAVASAEAVFRESFPNANLRLLESLKKLNMETGENVKKIMFKRAASLRAQDILIKSFESEYDSLVAQKKPNVSMRAGVTAPAENTINDGSANVGFLVNYIFSDGGRLNSQIEALKLQIKVSHQQKKTTERELQLQLDVAMQAYKSAQKTYYAMSDLVNFSKEVRDTSRDQLVSGRSKIQDVLSAEVSLAENRIQLLNAETEETLSSYRIKALSHGLTKGLGWKPL